MFLRHVAFRPAANYLRSNLFVSAGVRAFSSGSKRTGTSHQHANECTLIRRVVAEGHVLGPRRRKGDTLTDEEYLKWVHYPRKPSRFTTLCGISLQPYNYEAIEARLPTHLSRDPLKPFIDDPHALNLALATDCMQLYIYRLMEHTLGRGLEDRLYDRTLDASRFRACLRNDDAGAKALSWLLNSATHDRVETTFDPRLIQAIAFCLVGQGKTDIWWDMLQIAHAPKSIKDTTMPNERYSCFRWTNAWFTSILEAQVFWTSEQNCFSEPLETFLEVRRLNAVKPLKEPKIAIAGAFGWIMSKLPYYNRRNIKVEVYDDFSESCLRYLHGESIGRFKYGLLKLVHPVHQDPDFLLEHLRQSEFDNEDMQNLIVIIPGTMRLVVRLLMQHCYRIGRTADVRRTLDLYYLLERQREMLNGPGPRSKHGARATKRRKAWRSEISNGASIDAHGRLKVFPYHETLEEAHERMMKSSKVCC